MDIFCRKYPQLPFNELAQSKQVGTLESYMLEFEKLSLMLSNVYMADLDLLFTEELKKPFKWIMKSQKTATLKDAMNFPISPPKPNFPYKLKDGGKPWKNDSFVKENKELPRKEYLKINKFFFTC